MTALAVPRVGGILDDQDTRPDDLRLWSVSTILNVLDKPALQYWAAREAARYALSAEEVWRPIQQRHGDAEAVKYIAAARFRPPHGQLLESAELGTEVHRACQHYALFGQRPDDVHAEAVPFLDQFDRWLQRFQPTYEAAEVTVYSPTYGYAGTLDTIFTIPEQADADPIRLLNDYKTSREALDGKGKPKTPYSETVLQLAGYRFAERAAVWQARRMTAFKRRYYLLDPGEVALSVPVPEVDGASCLLITPASCELFPMRADRRAFDAFLYTLEVARYQLQDFRGNVGQPMVPPVREAIDV